MADDTTNGYELNEDENLDEAVQEVTARVNDADAPASSDVQELNNKYLRLYADFENYRKRVNKDKEDLVRYGNETLLYELLPVLDNLELALRHSADATNEGLAQGVEMTLKELLRTLEKFGVTKIDAVKKAFDPSVHHAMAQVERDDLDEQMVADELRSGYLYRDKVLRPSLVTVSVRQQKSTGVSGAEAPDTQDDVEIKINRPIEED
ncbi:MAG: nucleotide exchange factor GrpE [Nitrospirae bacterium]|nr:MAG: nucleotide exchange factor GrpE [Nitrospirota bacterium]